MSARSERLFVYGTLKRGQPNHHLLQFCPYQGEAVMPGLLLYDRGSASCEHRVCDGDTRGFYSTGISRETSDRICDQSHLCPVSSCVS